MTRKNHHAPDKSSMNDVNKMIFKNIVCNNQDQYYFKETNVKRLDVMIK